MGSFARRLGSLIAVAVPLALLTLASLPRLPAGLIPADYEWVRTLGAAIDPRAVMASLILLGLLVALRLGLRSGLGQRLMQTLVEDVFSNWRLLLLGLTGVLLSIASGYTTWDGMTNFTCPARGTGDACFGPMILSLLITFGIQGVMLIAAWLIGESFAQGLHQGRSGRAPEGRGQGVFYWTFWVLAVAAIVLTGAAVLTFVGSYVLGVETEATRRVSSDAFAYASDNRGSLLWGLIGLLTFFALLYALSEREIFGPYVRGLRIVLGNLPLWIMFLACMATSVFFSFDSLFSTIFPAEERARAAELRTTNQIAGIVSDVGNKIEQRRDEAVKKLLRSDRWGAYDQNLDAITKLAKSSGGTIRQAQIKLAEGQRQVEAGLIERRTSAESQRVGLDKRKEVLLADIARLKTEVLPLAAEVELLKAQVIDKDRTIIGKSAEVESEAGGIGVTGKEGRGPKFRELAAELDRLRKEKDLQVIAPMRSFEAQLKEKRAGLVALESELAQIDGEIGKLKGEISVAEQQLTLETATGAAGVPQFNNAIGADTLEVPRSVFRQRPEQETFAQLQSACVSLMRAFDQVPELAEKARATRVNCDPGAFSELTSQLFTLSAGVATFRQRCGAPDSLPQTGTDAVLAYGESCIQASSLDSRDTAVFRGAINGVALNRDDRAHRFVVTMNAFFDGNRLAYLALAIAIAIDGLVFMSGLFGANAVRSPLTDVPHGKARSASQLGAVINAALEPDRFFNARAAIGAMRPITPEDGYSQEVVLGSLDEDTRGRVSALLNAGSVLNAVKRDGWDADRYLVRSELFEYLGEVVERELRSNASARGIVAREQEQAARYRVEIAHDSHKSDFIRKRAEKLAPHIAAVLLPELKKNIGYLERALKPISDAEFRAKGYSSEVDPRALTMVERTLVESALNAGATLEAVVRVSVAKPGGEAGEHVERYFVKPEFGAALHAIKISAYDPKSRRTFTSALEHIDVEAASRMPAQRIADARFEDADPPRIAAPTPRQALPHHAGQHGASDDNGSVDHGDYRTASLAVLADLERTAADLSLDLPELVREINAQNQDPGLSYRDLRGLVLREIERRLEAREDELHESDQARHDDVVSRVRRLSEVDFGHWAESVLIQKLN